MRVVDDDQGRPGHGGGAEGGDHVVGGGQHVHLGQGCSQQLGQHAVVHIGLPRDGQGAEHATSSGPAFVSQVAHQGTAAHAGRTGHEHHARTVLTALQQKAPQGGELGVAGDQHGHGVGFDHAATVDRTPSGAGSVAGVSV